tara:strand:+ start:111 stop:626 length:516 start_codon:yes stop_codon:yes gene_type:complete
MTQELDFKAICSIATRVSGLQEGSLSFKNRSRNLQAARASACYIALTEENIDRNVIAKVLMKDRTSTYHYENTHKKKFKNCDIYRNTFIKIYQEYKNMEGQKNIFVSKSHLKNHLIKNKIKVVENKISEVLLEVKSGEAVCIVETSYFDYINQLKNISLALNNYHYTVKII